MFGGAGVEENLYRGRRFCNKVQNDLYLDNFPKDSI